MLYREGLLLRFANIPLAICIGDWRGFILSLKKRPSEWEQLVKDYHKSNAYIEWQKRHWITPPDERKENEERRKQAPSEEPNGRTGKTR